MYAMNKITTYLTLLSLACGGLVYPSTGVAADTAPAASPKEGAPPAVAKPDLGLPDRPPVPEVSQDNDTQLRQEIVELRADLQMLQSTLDLMVNQIMGDLRKENDQLRQEVRRLNALHQDAGFQAPVNVPRPDAVTSALLNEAPVMENSAETPEGEPAPPPPPEFTYNVVKEWGRDPEDAQKLGKDVGTLKGIIGLVPEGSLPEDLEKLGRDLRSKYASYDNVNIEVFDNEAVANRYAENEKGDPVHRVLIVQRHKASGRDIILRLDKGQATQVPIDGDIAPASPESTGTPEVSPPSPDMPVTTPQTPPADAAAQEASAPVPGTPPLVPREKAR